MFMVKYGIPTSKYESFTDPTKAKEFIKKYGTNICPSAIRILRFNCILALLLML